MSENRKFIIFFSWLTGLFLVATYVFSILQFEYALLTSDFLVVIFGGLFASFGVMLLAEIKKYFLNKRTAEDTLYYTLLNLYIELILEIKNADVYLNNPSTPVPDNLFSDSAPSIGQALTTLKHLDYSTFTKTKNSQRWNTYKAKEIPCLDEHLGYCRSYLFMAINRDELKAIDEKGLTAYHPTSQDQAVKVTLTKIKANAINRSQEIESLMEEIISSYKDRYSWEEAKKKIQNTDVGLPTDNERINSFFEE